MLATRCITSGSAGSRAAFRAPHLNSRRVQFSNQFSSTTRWISSFSAPQSSSICHGKRISPFQIQSKQSTPLSPAIIHQQQQQQQQQKRWFAEKPADQKRPERPTEEKPASKPLYESGYAWDYIPGFQHCLTPVMLKKEIEKLIRLPQIKRDNIILIDLRPAHKFNDYIIPGAVNLPLNDIWLHRAVELAPVEFFRLYRFHKPDITNRLIFYSDIPEDGDFAAFAFNVNGYPHCYNYRGGIPNFFNLTSEQLRIVRQPPWRGLESERHRPLMNFAQGMEDMMRKHEATHGPPDEDDSSEEVSQLSDIFASDGSSEGDAANEEGEGMERDEEEGQYDSSDQKRNISARSNAGSREESQSTPNWNAPSPNFRRPGRGVSRFSR